MTRAAEFAAIQAAGFDGVCWGDPFRPTNGRDGSDPGPAWLRAAQTFTTGLTLGAAVVAPRPGDDPAPVARSLAMADRRLPGRTFLAVGAAPGIGPHSTGWRFGAERLGPFGESLRTILNMLGGGFGVGGERQPAYAGRVDRRRTPRRPPVYVAARHAEGARLAGRLGDGLWTAADPETAPELITAYRNACADHGRAPGPVLCHATVVWAPDEVTSFLDADRWRNGPVDAPLSDPRRDTLILGPDPERHIAGLREIEALGPNAIVLSNASRSDPIGAIETYGRHVLPRVRSGAG